MKRERGPLFSIGAGGFPVGLTSLVVCSFRTPYHMIPLLMWTLFAGICLVIGWRGGHKYYRIYSNLIDDTVGYTSDLTEREENHTYIPISKREWDKAMEEH